jgi:hypothetical protein
VSRGQGRAPSKPQKALSLHRSGAYTQRGIEHSDAHRRLDNQRDERRVRQRNLHANKHVRVPNHASQLEDLLEEQLALKALDALDN